MCTRLLVRTVGAPALKGDPIETYHEAGSVGTSLAVNENRIAVAVAQHLEKHLDFAFGNVLPGAHGNVHVMETQRFDFLRFLILRAQVDDGLDTKLLQVIETLAAGLSVIRLSLHAV